MSALASAAPSRAHDTGNAVGPPSLATAWTLDPWLLAGLGLVAALYALGIVRLWSRAGAGHGVAGWRVAAFTAGIAACAFALVWPLDAFGEWSLAAHMAQHMLLMAVAAPLLALAQPVAVLLHALQARPSVVCSLQQLTRRSGLARLAGLGAATLLQAAAMLAWHLPAAMAAALANEAAHELMHLSFLATGLLFWMAALNAPHRPRPGVGGAAAALLTTMMAMGLVGALLTFATRPLYPFYVDRAPQLGLTPLADQQLAGLLMWVPSAVPYLLGMVLLGDAWLRRRQRRDQSA